ncbi:MAG: cytidine deaminase [Anaerolineales bacterium]|jgi:cytidine deaminase
MITLDQKQALVQKAILAQQNAYAPYSEYKVGATLLTKSGKTFSGANVENAVYPLTICAERSAVVNAVSAGEQDFEAMAVVTRDGGSPCGGCRQVMAEFGVDMLVLIADDSGHIHHELTVEQLLPHSFNAKNLQSSS